MYIYAIYTQNYTYISTFVNLCPGFSALDFDIIILYKKCYARKTPKKAHCPSWAKMFALISNAFSLVAG